MATRLLTKQVRYMPSFRAAVDHFRAFSWFSNGQNSSDFKYVIRGDTDSTTIWPDEKLGPFAPKDKRFILPGNVGHTQTMAPVLMPPQPTDPIDPEVLFQTMPLERQGNVIMQAQEEAELLEEMNPSADTKPTADSFLESTIHDCPELIRKEFAELFPGRDIMNGPFTVIMFSQRTNEDMTKWSEAVDNEREELLKTFIEGATEICQALRQSGYWGDFIDPSSGKPYLGDHTNDSMYETDDRYRRFGFEIEDLGCCKVIRHHLWGTHAYVGCIFTNAPSHDPILKTMK